MLEEEGSMNHLNVEKFPFFSTFSLAMYKQKNEQQNESEDEK